MRIVLLTGLGLGENAFGNVGDVAMLQVAVNRIIKLWPSSEIFVIASCADSLVNFCPNAKFLPSSGCVIWFSQAVLLGNKERVMPQFVLQLLRKSKVQLRRHLPNLVKYILSLRMNGRGDHDGDKAVSTFIECFANADLFVVCGAGGFSDICLGWNMQAMDLMEEAIYWKIPVVMLGQGLGPLSDQLTISRAKDIFPAIEFIGLRGSPEAAELLTSFGVSNKRFHTTGDDAIELAYEARPQDLGSSLGVNFRLGGSAQTDESDLDNVKIILQTFLQRTTVNVLHIPIAIHPHLRDDVAIRYLLNESNTQSLDDFANHSPIQTIRQIGRCRLVLTGAYHAAVFALAQGIPVICIARSPYFLSKFAGLRNLFGTGCQIIDLNKPECAATLNTCLQRVWETAETFRVPLLAAALDQIKAAKAAYEHVKTLLCERGGQRLAN